MVLEHAIDKPAIAAQIKVALMTDRYLFFIIISIKSYLAAGNETFFHESV